MRISVLGAGSWGTTLAIVLCENFRDVTLWSYRADQTEEMREARTNKDYLPGITLPKHLKITPRCTRSFHQKRSHSNGCSLPVPSERSQGYRSH